jgi:putative DNA primase/helicase
MDGNEEVRGVLNSGHTHRKAYVISTNRDTGKVERFSTWSPKAIARIGELSETLKHRQSEFT